MKRVGKKINIKIKKGNEFRVQKVKYQPFIETIHYLFIYINHLLKLFIIYLFTLLYLLHLLKLLLDSLFNIILRPHF